MFVAISIAGFIIVIAGITLHYLVTAPNMDDLFGKERRRRALDGLRVIIYLLTLLLPEQKLNIIGVLRKLVFLLGLLCFVVLVITGFVPLLILNKHLSGYLLMLHTTAAGVFSVCLAILAVMWADNCRFDKTDWPWLVKILRIEPVNITSQKYQLVLKITFWLIIFLALPLILSAILSMFKLFGTYQQEFLLWLHRYSALSITLAIIIHTYLLTRNQMP